MPLRLNSDVVASLILLAPDPAIPLNAVISSVIDRDWVSVLSAANCLDSVSVIVTVGDIVLSAAYSLEMLSVVVIVLEMVLKAAYSLTIESLSVIVSLKVLGTSLTRAKDSVISVMFATR